MKPIFIRLSATFVAALLLVTASSGPVCSEPPAVSEFDFQRDIGGIFTRHGCNATDCHGGVKGEGGFKLSLNAQYPDEDHRWIVRGGGFQVLTDAAKGEERPRINLSDPAESLLLLKPTEEERHGGGEVFKEDSPEYELIHKWIERGAPLSTSDRRVARLEVSPSLVVLDRPGSQRLRVKALLANGESEDFTDRVAFRSNNKEVARVDAAGMVQARAPGETAVVVRAAGHAVSARVSVVERVRRMFSDIPSRNFIDEHVFAKLEKIHVVPSAGSSDAEFLRRVCLDITGTLPPPGRVREFLSDESREKRDKLIETLLDSPEYVDYWTFRFADLFRVRGGRYYDWVHENIALNRPYDQVARERIAAQGFDGASRFYSMAVKARPLERVVSEDMRVFMGRRLDCAQCHNHPFEAWSQTQFWGLAAFYGRLTLTEWVNPADSQCVLDDPEGQEIDFGMDGVEELKFIKVVHPRTEDPIEPTFLDGRTLTPEQRDDPRRVLARWITEHPYFGEAIVNRIWSHFFGRGIVDPVDNFSSTNLPTHPELLDALAKDFREHGHDLKRLIRSIATSRAYQLSSFPNDSNSSDAVNYSHAQARPLDAEVLLDAIASAVGVPMRFERALPFQPTLTAYAPAGTRAIQLKVPLNYVSRFLEIYGRPFRNAVTERDSRPNLTQALHVLVGSTYTEGLSREGGRIDALLEAGSNDATVIEELYLSTLTRLPSTTERRGLEAMLGEGSTSPESRRKTIEDLLWALVASREFAYNK